MLEGLRRLEYRGYDSAGIALSSDEHVIVEINPSDDYVIDDKHKALVLR